MGMMLNTGKYINKYDKCVNKIICIYYLVYIFFNFK